MVLGLYTASYLLTTKFFIVYGHDLPPTFCQNDSVRCGCTTRVHRWFVACSILTRHKRKHLIVILFCKEPKAVQEIS